MSGPIRASVLTVSDRCFRGEATDESGPALVQLLRDALGAEIVEAGCVADDADGISGRLIEWCDGESSPDLILTTGGTGLSPRDNTPEAAMAVIERPHQALIALILRRCGETTPLAYLSRGVAGVRGRTLIVTLPGSVRGATESLEALVDVLPHAIAILRGPDAGGGDPHA